MALDLEVILRETAANFAATTQLPELEKSGEFAKIPNGTKKSFKGQEYELKSSRWHRVSDGKELATGMKLPRYQDASKEIRQSKDVDKLMHLEKKYLGIENLLTSRDDWELRQEQSDKYAHLAQLAGDKYLDILDKQELAGDLEKRPYTLTRNGDQLTIVKPANVHNLSFATLHSDPQSIDISPADNGQYQVSISKGRWITRKDGEVDQIEDLPATTHLINKLPPLSKSPTQIQIHDFIYHSDRGVLKKPGGGFAQFGKSVIKKPAAKKKNCKPTSISCGFSCISGKKICRITMTMEQQRAAKALKKELRAGKRAAANQSKELIGIAAIHAFEREKYKQSFESAMAVDFRGQKAFTKDGTSNEVAFTSEEVNQMASGILSHNHPDGWNFEADDPRSGGNSFSRDDLEIAVGADLSEIRAISRKYIHSMLRPPNGWPSLSAAEKMIATIEATQQHQGGQRLYNSQQLDSPEEFQKLQNKMNADYWHDLVTSYADLIGAKYTRKEHGYQ